MLSRLIFLCAAVGLATSLVINPQITSPSAGQVWPANSTQKVTWSTRVAISPTATGSIVLGYLSEDPTDLDEHLDLDHPLATGFKLADGELEIVVPDAAPLDRYIIVLLGDSGNASPQFTITNPNHPNSA